MTTDCIIHHWRVDYASGSLINQQSGEQRRLGEFQFKLLEVLIEHVGQPLTRDELTALVWERRVIGSNSLPNAVHALRVALEDDGKQQRIIRTLPRKGYILEAEFCQFVPAAAALPAAGETPETDENAAPIAIVPDPQPELIAAPTAPAPRFWRRVVTGQLLVLLLVVGWLGIRWLPATHSELSETGSQAWSNIRMVELYRGWEAFSAAEDLTTQLGPVLYPLNQQLAASKTGLDVFFYAYGSSLNITLSLKSACARQQLAMNISNWRTDGVQLTALIYRETQRKINEMASCVN